MLAIQAIEKQYGTTVALRGLDLVVPAGRVFGIAGPNGAGKSTLIRILAGEETEDAGSIVLDGSVWSQAERQVDTAVVHQEPQLFPNLTVLQNLHFGRTLRGFGSPRVSGREREIITELDLEPFAGRELGSCPLVVWQLTEIGRALLREARLFLFDEPNSALSDEESDLLFAQLRRLASRADRHVIMVSHRLGDLTELSGQVAVVREGRCTEVLTGTDVTEHALARALVVGVATSGIEREQRAGEGDQLRVPIARLADWESRSGSFRDVNLTLFPGQVVAIMGVEGSGGRELVRSLAGLEPARGGYELLGQHAIASGGIAYMPAARRDSLFGNFSIRANLGVRLGRPEIAGRSGLLAVHRLDAMSRGLVDRFRIVAASTGQGVATLSGGNQQKVALAGTLASRPRLLAVEEPTRGVDIGTKAEIYRTLRAFVREGNAVVTFCTEVSEVFDVADTIHVTSGGRLSEPIDVHASATIEDLAAAVASVSRQMRDDADLVAAPLEDKAGPAWQRE
jgi:ABC-type sugar transport system ATPase subunit